MLGLYLSNGSTRRLGLFNGLTICGNISKVGMWVVVMMINILPHPVEDAALLHIYCNSDVFGWDEWEYTKRYVECIWSINSSVEVWVEHYPDAAVSYMSRWSQFIQYGGFRVITPQENFTALEYRRMGPAFFDVDGFIEESDDDSLFD